MDTLIAFSWSQTESEVLDFSCFPHSSCLGFRLSLHFADGKLKCSGKWLTHSQTVIEAQRNILEPGPSASLIRGLTLRVVYYYLELFSHRLVLRQHLTPGPCCCHYSSSTIPAEKVLLPEVWKQQILFFPFSHRKGNMITVGDISSLKDLDPEVCVWEAGPSPPTSSFFLSSFTLFIFLVTLMALMLLKISIAFHYRMRGRSFPLYPMT